MKMIAKIDDRNVTDEMVQAMTAQELKAFENRLRSVAQRKGLNFNKYAHPVRGISYAVTKSSGKAEANKRVYLTLIEVVDLSIIEMKDYLYKVK